ncbi:MAG: polyprenyl synthetase family protein [Bacillota bacterium]
MDAIFLELIKPIESQLKSVEQLLEKDMYLKAGHISNFIQLDLDIWDKYMHPAVLLLSAAMFRCSQPFVTAMACVMQLIHIATAVHYRKYSQKGEMSILIGDYLYTKSYSYLCNHSLHQWLSAIAWIICQIHEAGVRKKELESVNRLDLESYLDIVRKQSGLLLGECSAFGAVASGADPKVRNAARALGVDLGVAWALTKDACFLPAEEALWRAECQLDFLPAGQERDIFKDLIQLFHRRLRIQLQEAVG